MRFAGAWADPLTWAMPSRWPSGIHGSAEGLGGWPQVGSIDSLSETSWREPIWIHLTRQPSRSSFKGAPPERFADRPRRPRRAITSPDMSDDTRQTHVHTVIDRRDEPCRRQPLFRPMTIVWALPGTAHIDKSERAS